MATPFKFFTFVLKEVKTLLRVSVLRQRFLHFFTICFKKRKNIATCFCIAATLFPACSCHRALTPALRPSQHFLLGPFSSKHFFCFPLIMLLDNHFSLHIVPIIINTIFTIMNIIGLIMGCKWGVDPPVKAPPDALTSRAHPLPPPSPNPS